MGKKIKRERYSVNYETWEFNEDEQDYVDGPFDSKNFDVDTLEEAMKCINDFIVQYPDATEFEIQYDKKDPFNGILKQKLIKALRCNRGEHQYTIDVFYLKTDW